MSLESVQVVKCLRVGRICQCGRSGGKYAEDGLNATYWGDAIPLGFANSSLVSALENQPLDG